jgi:hypothetical protein
MENVVKRYDDLGNRITFGLERISEDGSFFIYVSGVEIQLALDIGVLRTTIFNLSMVMVGLGMKMSIRMSILSEYLVRVGAILSLTK